MIDRVIRLGWLMFDAWRAQKKRKDHEPMVPQSQLDLRVGLLDIDINRHLTNSRYLFYMDLGRWDLFLRSGRVQKALREQISMALVELDVKFRHELKPWQSFRLDSRIVEIRAKLVTIEHYFIVGDKIHAYAQARILITKKRKVISPEDFMSMVSAPLAVQNWRVKAKDEAPGAGNHVQNSDK